MKRVLPLSLFLALSFTFTACNNTSTNAPAAVVNNNPIAPLHINWIANREKAVNSPGGGYKVYYSNSAGFSLSSATIIDVPYVSGATAPVTAVTPLLPAGTYYFKVIAYSALTNLSGTQAQSAVSTEMTASVP